VARQRIDDRLHGIVDDDSPAFVIVRFERVLDVVQNGIDRWLERILRVKKYNVHLALLRGLVMRALR
jgi:hypothetical protein